MAQVPHKESSEDGNFIMVIFILALIGFVMYAVSHTPPLVSAVIVVCCLCLYGIGISLYARAKNKPLHHLVIEHIGIIIAIAIFVAILELFNLPWERWPGYYR